MSKSEGLKPSTHYFVYLESILLEEGHFDGVKSVTGQTFSRITPTDLSFPARAECIQNSVFS